MYMTTTLSQLHLLKIYSHIFSNKHEYLTSPTIKYIICVTILGKLK